MKFTPFPNLSTERLVLRRIREEDWKEMLFLRSDPTVNRYIERPPERQTKTQDEALQFIRDLQSYEENDVSITWAMALKEEPTLIGTICLWNFSADKKTTEVGYALDPAFQNLGIMSEAMACILEFGFKHLEVELIEAFTHRENEASKKLLTTHGFLLAADRTDQNNAYNWVYERKNTGI